MALKHPFLPPPPPFGPEREHEMKIFLVKIFSPQQKNK